MSYDYERRIAADQDQYPYLVVYAYQRPGARITSWAVATGDDPNDIVFRNNSKPAAINWANKRCKNVHVDHK